LIQPNQTTKISLFSDSSFVARRFTVVDRGGTTLSLSLSLSLSLCLLLCSFSLLFSFLLFKDSGLSSHLIHRSNDPTVEAFDLLLYFFSLPAVDAPELFRSLESLSIQSYSLLVCGHGH
jgi:hypothetical protein